MAGSCHDVSFLFQRSKPSACLGVSIGTSGSERPVSRVAGGGWGELAEQGLSKRVCYQWGKYQRDAQLQPPLTAVRVAGCKTFCSALRLC